MSEYSDCMDNMHDKAEKDGLATPDIAWLNIDGIDWPNPHYKGVPVNHPLDDTGTQTNPPAPSPLNKYRDGSKYGDKE